MIIDSIMCVLCDIIKHDTSLLVFVNTFISSTVPPTHSEIKSAARCTKSAPALLPSLTPRSPIVALQGESVTVSGMAGGKIEPGLSSFADRPADAAAHVKPLLLAASELVPQERHANTKVRIRNKRE